VWVLDADAGSCEQIVRSCLQNDMLAVGHRTPEEHFAALYRAVPLCIVVDYRTGSEDGLSVIARTRDLTWPLPAILMARDLDVPLVTKAFRSGCSTVLAKPLDMAQMRLEVQEAIRLGSKALAEYEQRLEAKSRYADLTPNQRLVLREMLLGARNKSIAERLGISLRTVDKRKQEIFQAFGVENLAGLLNVVRLIRLDSANSGSSPHEFPGPDGAI
jgi:FixJ family two-component response regulator